MASARALAQALHTAKYDLVYGGGTVGIMGELARTLVSLSGPQRVHGVIPRALIRTEKGYDGTRVGEQGKAATTTTTTTKDRDRPGSSATTGKEAEKTMTSEEFAED